MDLIIKSWVKAPAVLKLFSSSMFSIFYFRNLKAKIQENFREYLDARGVNNELSVFLQEYMMNKDRIELLRWMVSLKYFMEK